jgi:hypothetical protein
MLDLNLELNPRLTDTLRCPVCGAPMGVSAEGRGLACVASVTERNPKGKTHLFDGGAGGYVNLAPTIAEAATPRRPSAPAPLSCGAATMPPPPRPSPRW